MEITFVLAAMGLILLLVWLVPSPLSWFGRRALQKRHEAELLALRTHLHTRMEIDAEGLQGLKDQNERLKRLVQNLRFNNQMLSNKPQQAELRLLHMYARAVEIMERRFPVLIPTWRAMVAAAEKEMREADEGFTALVKRVFRLSGQIRELPPPDAENMRLLRADGVAEIKAEPATHS